MKPSRGYTIMEVMMSMSVLAIGAAGVITMQKATVYGNTHARNLATANAVAATWAERLRADGALWTNPADAPSTLANTRWLKEAEVTTGDWFSPTAIDDVGSPAADVLGADLYSPGDADPEAQAFCTQMRLTQVYPTLIRAEIRVFWSRASVPVTCDLQVDPASEVGKYGFVYVTTGIHQTVLP